MQRSEKLPTWGMVSACCLCVTGCRTPFAEYRISNINLQKHVETLPNGLRVIIEPEPSEAETVVTVRYGVGSAFDLKEEKGLAHVVEHLAFRLDDQIINRGEPHSGATATSSAAALARKVTFQTTSNAWTAPDETFYHFTFVPMHLPDVLERVAATMGDFSGRVSKEVLQVEREVVRNERRQRYDDPQGHRWFVDLEDRYRRADHPYHLAGIGSNATLDAISLESVRRFLDAHYHPANAVLCIIGPVDVESTLALVRKYFAAKPKKPPSVLPEQWKNWKPTYREEVVEVPGQRGTVIAMAWPLAPSGSDEASSIAFASESQNELWYRLVRREGLAYSVGAWVAEEDYESTFYVIARSDDADDPSKLRDAMLGEVEHLAKIQWVRWLAPSQRRNVYDRLYDVEDPVQRAHGMIQNLLRFDDPLAWPRDFDRVLAIPPDFARQATTKLSRDRAFVLIERPPKASSAPHKKSVGEQTRETVSSSSRDLHEDRDLGPELVAFSQPPESYTAWADGAARRWSEAQEFVLANGMRCRITKTGGLPLMSLRLKFGGGGLVEPPEAKGVQAIMLRSGSLVGREDKERSWRIGWKSDLTAGITSTEFHFKFLSLYADEAMRILADRIFDPKFLRDEIVREREQLQKAQARHLTNIDELARRGMWKQMGILAASQQPTEETLEAVSRAEVVSFHERVVYPENGLISIASDLDPQVVRGFVEKRFGSIGGAGRAPVDIRTIGIEKNAATAPAIVLVPVEQAPQSRIMLSLEVPGHDQWEKNAEAHVLSELLTRAARRLRESLGVTYGVGFKVVSVGARAMLVGSTKVEPDGVSAAVAVLDEVFQNVASRQIDPGELDIAKRTVMRDFAGPNHSVEESSALHAQEMDEHRPLGFARTRVAYVAGLKGEDLGRTVQSLSAVPRIVVIAGRIPENIEALAKKAGRKIIRYTPEALVSDRKKPEGP